MSTARGTDYATLASTIYHSLSGTHSLEKSNIKHKTTKSAHKMPNHMKQMAKRQISAFLCEPIREPSVTSQCRIQTFR